MKEAKEKSYTFLISAVHTEHAQRLLAVNEEGTWEQWQGAKGPVGRKEGSSHSRGKCRSVYQQG